MRKDTEHRHPYGERIDGFLVTEHPLYSVWNGMWARCTSPVSTSWLNYGARGIRVCDEWLKFAQFVSDMGPRPSDMHTIEREDTNGDYTPKNCVWATHSEQCVNRRTFKNNSSGATGVTLRGGSWIARFDFEHVRYNVGWFKTRDEAVAARQAFVNSFFSDRELAMALLPKDKARHTSNTGVRGITRHVDGGYTVRITLHGTRHYLGYFEDFDEACTKRIEFLAQRDADDTALSRDTDKARRNSKTGVRGINPNNGGFIVRVNVGGKRVYVGKFNTIEEAANAREEFLAKQVA